MIYDFLQWIRTGGDHSQELNLKMLAVVVVVVVFFNSFEDAF